MPQQYVSSLLNPYHATPRSRLEDALMDDAEQNKAHIPFYTYSANEVQARDLLNLNVCLDGDVGKAVIRRSLDAVYRSLNGANQAQHFRGFFLKKIFEPLDAWLNNPDKSVERPVVPRIIGIPTMKAGRPSIPADHGLTAKCLGYVSNCRDDLPNRRLVIITRGDDSSDIGGGVNTHKTPSLLAIRACLNQILRVDLKVKNYQSHLKVEIIQHIISKLENYAKTIDRNSLDTPVICKMIDQLGAHSTNPFASGQQLVLTPAEVAVANQGTLSKIVRASGLEIVDELSRPIATPALSQGRRNLVITAGCVVGLVALATGLVLTFSPVAPIGLLFCGLALKGVALSAVQVSVIAGAALLLATVTSALAHSAKSLQHGIFNYLHKDILPQYSLECANWQP